MSNDAPQVKKSKLPLLLTISYIVLIVGTFMATKKLSPPSVVYVYKDQQMPETKAFARINGQDLSELELVGDSFESWIGTKQRVFDYHMNRLQEHLFNKFSVIDAEKAGISVGEFLKTKVFEEPISVSDAEIQAYIEERKLPGDSINVPAEKEKLKNQVIGNKKKIKKERYIAKVISENNVEVFFPRPVGLKDYLKTDGLQLEGSEQAPNKLILYFNFNNGGNMKTLAAFQDLHSKKKSEIRFIIKHHFDPKRPETELAALGALCAHKLGSFEAYLELSQQILKLGGRMPKAPKELATLYSKDPAALETCLQSGTFNNQLRSEQAQAKILMNNPSVTSFLNGKRLNLVKKTEDLEKDVENILRPAK